jgi:hypothetical protein
LQRKRDQAYVDEEKLVEYWEIWAGKIEFGILRRKTLEKGFSWKTSMRRSGRVSQRSIWIDCTFWFWHEWDVRCWGVCDWLHDCFRSGPGRAGSDAWLTWSSLTRLQIPTSRPELKPDQVRPGQFLSRQECYKSSDQFIGTYLSSLCREGVIRLWLVRKCGEI